MRICLAPSNRVEGRPGLHLRHSPPRDTSGALGVVVPEGRKRPEESSDKTLSKKATWQKAPQVGSPSYKSQHTKGYLPFLRHTSVYAETIK